MATNGQQKRQVNRQQQGQQQKKLEKRKPVFVKKGQAASQQLRQGHIAECLVGDETGTILFIARNDQVDLAKPDTTVILRNAKTDMFKGSTRLAVDRWDRIEVTDPSDVMVEEDNNLCLVEYELVNVVDE
ncbi:hypothetical protein SLA2020_043660 [Shorea laevis]